jgi:hypothetical protein
VECGWHEDQVKRSGKEVFNNVPLVVDDCWKLTEEVVKRLKVNKAEWQPQPRLMSLVIRSSLLPILDYAAYVSETSDIEGSQNLPSQLQLQITQNTWKIRRHESRKESHDLGSRLTCQRYYRPTTRPKCPHLKACTPSSTWKQNSRLSAASK